MDYNLYKLFNKFIKFGMSIEAKLQQRPSASGFKVRSGNASRQPDGQRSLKLNGLEEWRNKSKNLSEDNIVGNWTKMQAFSNLFEGKYLV